MKTSELRIFATGQQPYATFESRLAAEVIRQREALKKADQELGSIGYRETMWPRPSILALLTEHDE